MDGVMRGLLAAGLLTMAVAPRLARSEPAVTESADGAVGGGGFLRLDGRSALRVELPETPGTLTLEAWVRGGPPKGRQGLLCNTEASGFAIFWSDIADGGALPAGFVHAGGVWASAGADRPWDFARWTHVAMSYDGARVRFFVNGRLTGEAEAAGPITPNRLPLVIGADVDAEGEAVSFWTGDLDEVRLSRVARYTGDFEAAWRLTRDADTVVLLNFDEPLDDEPLDSEGAGSSGSGRCGVVGTPRVVLPEE
jgi:hypothetical protein